MTENMPPTSVQMQKMQRGLQHVAVALDRATLWRTDACLR